MTAALGSETFPTFLDVQEQVKPWLEYKGVDYSQDEVLNLIVDGVCTEAQRQAGGPIAPKQYGPNDGLGKFDGSGGLNSGYIMLPRTRVIQVEEVIEYQGQAAVTLTEIVDPAGITGNVGITDGYQVNYRTGRVTRVLGGIWNRPFYPGSNNVWITWTAGYNPIPQDMIMAALEWIAAVFHNTQAALTARPGVSPSQEYDPSTSPSPLYWGVPNRIVQVFQSYRRLGIR